MSVRSNTLPADASAEAKRAHLSSLVLFFEAVFFLWVGLAAAAVFLGSLILAASGVISLATLGFIYAGLTLVTFFLAILVYFARPGLDRE